MAFVGWYVYAYLTHETIAIDLFGVPMPSVSVALLVLAPIFILYIGSVLHMSFYSMLANLKIRKSEKDYEKLFDSIIDAYLGKANRKHNFKTPTFELFGNLLDNSVVFPNQKIVLNSDDDKSKKVNAALKAIEEIKSGEVVDLKQYSLSIENELVIQNNRNMYKKGNISAEDILSRANKYSETLCKEVYVDFVKTASVAAIDKYKQHLTKNALFVILSRVNANENTLEISNEAILTLLSNLEMDMKDYVNMANITSSGMIPEQRIKLFETLSNQNDEATDAYLFTLFDLEMLSPAYALLDISQADEYKNFKAYRALKECNQQFNIELFI